jgi:hypothetical protein
LEQYFTRIGITLQGLAASHFLEIYCTETICSVTRITYKIVPLTNMTDYWHYGKMELRNMYINIGANNGSEKLWTKKTATSGKQIKAVYVSYVCVYVSCTS